MCGGRPTGVGSGICTTNKRGIETEETEDWVTFEWQSGSEKVVKTVAKQSTTSFHPLEQSPPGAQRIASCLFAPPTHPGDSSSGADSEGNPVRTTFKIFPINWIDWG